MEATAPEPPKTNAQWGPYPQILDDLVKQLRYRPGWTFKLQEIERDPASTHGVSAGGLTFIGLTGTRIHQEGGGWSYNDQGDLVRDPTGGHYAYEGAMDAYHPDVARPVYFYFPVPAATYDERSWKRWLLDRLLDVELHETIEHFQIGDERPYSPSHGPGNDPYMIREYGTDEDRRTSFQGVLKEA